MNIRSPEDVIPPRDQNANPGKVVRRVSEALRSGVLDLRDLKKAEEECSFMRAVVKGMVDLDQGRETPLAEVKTRLGLT